MIGHELTAKYGLDHARTLAVVLPALLHVRREGKRAKLLQYAAKVWGITDGDEDARIDAAIHATRDFFERLWVPTHLSEYGVQDVAIPAILGKLTEHGMTAIGERHDITPDTVRQILKLAA